MGISICDFSSWKSVPSPTGGKMTSNWRGYPLSLLAKRGNNPSSSRFRGAWALFMCQASRQRLTLIGADNVRVVLRNRVSCLARVICLAHLFGSGKAELSFFERETAFWCSFKRVPNWRLKEHTCQTNHTIAWDNSKIITTNRRYHQRRCLEAWRPRSFESWRRWIIAGCLLASH